MSLSFIKFIKNRFRFSMFLLIVIYLVGVVTVILGHTGSLMRLTPYNLVFAAFIILYNAEGFGKTYIGWFVLIALAGYLIELAGILTGVIFGEYTYGAGLGIKLFNVPLIIGVNWAVLVFATAALTDRFHWPVWLKSAIAATLMVSYDILLEPVAIRFDFWSWAGETIPIQNYAAWWIIAFFMLLGTFRFVADRRNRLALPVILIQTIFFIVVIFQQGLSLR
jgi:bisanhydrobacterioruberin hydratase